jgi:hypothetical protein
MTPFQQAELRAYEMQNRAAELGLTAQDIRSMDFDEYCRLFDHSETPTQSALRALGITPTVPAPALESAQEPPAPEPPAVDPNVDFLAWRASRARGGEGVGLFSSVGSQSAEYVAAVRAHSGRTALNERGVVAPPRLEGRTVLKQDDRLDHRSAADRFSNPSNIWQR